MSRIRYDHSDTVEIECLDNGKKVTADVIDYHHQKKMSVSVDKNIKLVLSFNTNKNKYFGKLGSLEFVSNGPEITPVKSIKRG